MTKINSEECLRGAKEILGITQEDGTCYLNWPLKVITTQKSI